jgi:cytochrome c oxidase subunit II
MPLALLQLPQSAMGGQGDVASRILEVTWVLFIGGGLIFLVVVLVGLAALAGPASVRAWVSRRSFVLGAGVVFPVVVLTVLLAYTFGVAAGLVRAQAEPAAVRVHVTGEMWWWRVRYLDASGAMLMETANEIRIPAGQPVDVQLSSQDVIHSFWVPNLAAKLDMIPGKVNKQRLHAREPGVYRGQCAEFCGAQHANMAFIVVVQPAAEFEGWLKASASPAAEPATELARRGQALFAQSRCTVCHTIRGTPADGRLGPDLTHVGSRLSLGAGTLPNGAGALAGWISDPQHVKPGVRMPGYRLESGEDLRALAAYLEGLR